MCRSQCAWLGLLKRPHVNPKFQIMEPFSSDALCVQTYQTTKILTSICCLLPSWHKRKFRADGWQRLELSMSMRSALPYVALHLGVLATVAWMAAIGYGAFQIITWVIG